MLPLLGADPPSDRCDLRLMQFAQSPEESDKKAVSDETQTTVDAAATDERGRGPWPQLPLGAAYHGPHGSAAGSTLLSLPLVADPGGRERKRGGRRNGLALRGSDRRTTSGGIRCGADRPLAPFGADGH